MDTRLLARFQDQVTDQCKFVMMAADDVGAAMAQAGVSDTPTEDRWIAHDRLWFSLQNLLNAAANISKALWGGGGKLEEERQPLRESLRVPDDSPLKDTDLRNHFEHYDERMDRWDQESAAHNVWDRNVGSAAMGGFDQFDPIDRFRHFDPGTSLVWFWGEAFDIRALVEASRSLLTVASQESSKPHWKRSNPNTSGRGQ